MPTKNKVRQAQRRAIRSVYAEKIKLFSKVVKPRPKWCPRFIWQWGARQYMDIDLLKKLLGEE